MQVETVIQKVTIHTIPTLITEDEAKELEINDFYKSIILA
jgi:hypothetical protein